MKIEDFNEYKFTGGSQYTLDEHNYVVAVKEDSIFSNKNILPLYYITPDFEILGIDDEEVGGRILVISTQRDTVTEDIATRFTMNELFKIVRGPFQYNDRHDIDHNLPQKKIYKNYLQPFGPNEIIEIFDSVIDISKTRILVNNKQLRDFISKKYVGTNQSIFCFQDTKIIGPFILTGIDDEEYFIAEKCQGFKFGIHELRDDDFIEVNANGIARRIMYDSSVLQHSFVGDFDFISNRKLLNWFDSEILGKGNISLIDKRAFDELINQVEKLNNNTEIVESKERYERIYKILSDTKETVISKHSLLNALPQFQFIKEELETLEKRRLDLKNDIDYRVNELDTTQRKISEYNNSIEDLRKKISELKTQQEVEQDKIRENIKSEISRLEDEKNSIQCEIETERKELSQTLDNLKEEIKYQEKRKNELDTAIDTLKREFTSEQKNAQEKLSELVKQNTHFNFISGRDLPSDTANSSNFKDYSFKDEVITEYVSLRTQVVDILKNQQRHFENHFIDNLLISIHQNTLTLFAGLPGTGKTSLARIITSVLSSPERTREVPVARGWTSQKDLIGFANPLSKKFYESQSGLYRLLQQLDFEWHEKLYLETPLAFVILDEANLSPLEHYWSTFYNTTDTFATNKKPININLGQSEYISHANTLRFIGTINYDQTTEELSPRILDRTNIIKLMPQHFHVDNVTQSEITSLRIRFNEIIKIFKLTDFNSDTHSVQMNDFLTSRYEEIKESFSKLNIYISPRVELGIKRYCQVASTVMTEDSRPLDYCIAQRLLPLINIQGNVKSELSDLSNKIKNFNLDSSISYNILNKIIEIGSRAGYTQDTYNYFLTLTHV